MVQARVRLPVGALGRQTFIGCLGTDWQVPAPYLQVPVVSVMLRWGEYLLPRCRWRHSALVRRRGQFESAWKLRNTHLCPNGQDSAFQAEEAGSTPAGCSRIPG